jgi:hypothetical protein
MICPAEYISFSRLLDLMESVDEHPLWGELGQQCARGRLVNLYSAADLMMFRITSFLGENLFVCDYSGNILRIDSSIFSSMLSMNPPRGSGTKSRDAIFDAANGLFDDFRLGFRLDEFTAQEFRLSERALEVFERGITFHQGKEGVLTKFDDDAETLAARMSHFVYQDNFLTSSVFINYRSCSIDLSLYDWIVDWEAKNGETQLDLDAHVWAKILRPIEGQFFCVPKRFLPTPDLKKEFAVYAVDENFPMENEVRSGPKKRGAKPSEAKSEYYRLYPSGRPEGVSCDAIAAELTERGFPVVGRTVLNYENARNNS